MARLGFTVEQVRSFVAVADAGSITAAARTLFLSQAAVTQQVRNFERALGLSLLERTGGRIQLTGAGESVADACRAAMRSLKAVEDAARNASSLAVGSLHLAATPVAAAVYLPRLLAGFAARFPAVGISIAAVNHRTALERVHDGSLDCAVVEGPVNRPDLSICRVAEDELVTVVAVGHRLAGARRVAPADLLEERYLGREPGSALEIYAAEMLGPVHDRARRIELGHMDAVHGAVRAGLGFAVLPAVVVDQDVREGRLAILPVEPRRRWITAIRRPSHGSPPLEEFWRFAEAAQAQLDAVREPTPAVRARPAPLPE